MQEIIKNADGTTSVVENNNGVAFTTNPNDGIDKNNTVNFNARMNQNNDVNHNGVINSYNGTARNHNVPAFVSTDKEQKFFESQDSEGRPFRTHHVNETRTADYFVNRRVTNLVTNDKAPLVSFVEISFNPGTKDITACIKYQIDLLSSTAVYYSTAPVKLTLGTPDPVVTPSDALVAREGDLLKRHEIELKGLKSNTVYNYVICTKDNSGNENVTLNDSFKTPALLLQ